MMPFHFAGFAALVIVTALACAIVPHSSLFLRERRCPRCGPRVPLERTSRRFGERMLGRVIACRKYQCRACGWAGLIRDRAAKPAGEAASTSEFELRAFQGTSTAPNVKGRRP